jgi:hypothetical protein
MKTKLLLPLLLLLSGISQAQSASDSTRLIRVLTLNILHGATTKGDFDLDAIARVICDAVASDHCGFLVVLELLY